MSAPQFPRLITLLRSYCHASHSENGKRTRIWSEDWADEHGEIFYVMQREVRRFRPLKSEGPNAAQSRALKQIEKRMQSWLQAKSSN